jgi:probable rRNA maturation factor
MDINLNIINKTKGKLPSLPFEAIKQDILGADYSLSIVFVGKKFSRELNFKYRNKDRATNILSFPLNKKEGDIFICPSVVKIESKDKEKNFGKNFRELLGFLVIHGMLHLKGYEHSVIMEKAETKYDKKHFGGDRHRNLDHKSARRRIHQRRKLS